MCLDLFATESNYFRSGTLKVAPRLPPHNRDDHGFFSSLLLNNISLNLNPLRSYATSRRNGLRKLAHLASPCPIHSWIRNGDIFFADSIDVVLPCYCFIVTTLLRFF